MDVVRGDFAFDFASGAVKGAPGKQYLDPEIAGEGTKVILTNGNQVTIRPSPVQAVMPDWSQYKPIRHYFGRTDYQFFPCWLYHPTQEAVKAESAQEAGEKYGVELVERTDVERAEFGGGRYRWKFHGPWRVVPYHIVRSSVEANGKNLEIKRADPIAELAKALQISRGEDRNADPAMLEEFRQFQAWKTQQPLPPVEAPVQPELNAGPAEVPLPAENAAGNGDEEKQIWIAKAAEEDIKLDVRWTAETMKKYVTHERERRLAERKATQREQNK